MPIKIYPAQVKATAGDDGSDLVEGQFEAIVSAFGNVDTYGDVVMPGAFADDLARWKDSGDPLPVIWSHQWIDPFSHLGSVLEAEEREAGLWVKAQIDDLDTNAKAAQVYRLLKQRRVTQFSFAYDVIDGGLGERDGEHVYELRKLKVHEVGPCLVGVNQDTELLTVKAARDIAARAGRVVAAAGSDGAADAHIGLLNSLKTYLDTTNLLATGEDDQEKAAALEAKDEEPEGAKSEEPAPADDLAAPRNQLRLLAMAGKEGEES